MDNGSRVQLQNALKTLSANRADEDAWRILYEQTRATGVDVAKRVLRDHAELADDVAQEAFLRIFRYCTLKSVEKGRVHRSAELPKEDAEIE